MLDRVRLKDRPDARVTSATAGAHRIDQFTISEDEAKFHNLRCMVHGNWQDRVDPGKYTRLRRGGTIVMTDTPMELRSNRPAARCANGDVLIAGLGLGLLLDWIVDKPDVGSVTVIEKERDVIDMVAPAFPGVTVIHGDIHDAKKLLPKGKRFDFAWLDIWDNVPNGDDWEEIKKLRRSLCRRCTQTLAWREESARYGRSRA